MDSPITWYRLIVNLSSVLTLMPRQQKKKSYDIIIQFSVIIYIVLK